MKNITCFDISTHLQISTRPFLRPCCVVPILKRKLTDNRKQETGKYRWLKTSVKRAIMGLGVGHGYGSFDEMDGEFYIQAIRPSLRHQGSNH